MRRLKSNLLLACTSIMLLAGSNVALGVGNDDCSNAEAIAEVIDKGFETREATFDGSGRCISGPNIWYCYTASCTGTATVSLLGSGYDTKLAVYDGCGCDSSLGEAIGCNDDFGSTFQSELSFPVISGHKYLIEVGGYASDVGRGVLNVTCIRDPSHEPQKDECAGAEPIEDVKNLPFSTTGMTFDGSGLCMTSPNIWFCYTATCTGDVTVSLAGSGFDTMLAVYDGCECYPEQKDMIACNDDAGNSFQSEITFAAVAGTKYLIEIGGYASDTGDGMLTVSCEGKAGQVAPDLGDAPDGTNNSGNKPMYAYPSPPTRPGRFPTVYDDGSGTGPYGPVHLNETAVAFLGKTITGESEADTGPDEDASNNLGSAVNTPDLDGGDDAVNMPLVLPDCGWAKFQYQVTVIDPNVDLWVNVWLDFDRDGDWDDTLECPDGPAREWAVQNQFLFNLPAGLNDVVTPGFRSVHPENARDEIWMRITLSEQPWTGGSSPGVRFNAGSGPVEKYQIGETEDYFFTPEVPDDADCPLCEDFNGDGVVDLDDLSDFTAQWLATCL